MGIATKTIESKRKFAGIEECKRCGATANIYNEGLFKRTRVVNPGSIFIQYIGCRHQWKTAEKVMHPEIP